MAKKAIVRKDVNQIAKMVVDMATKEKKPKKALPVKDKKKAAK